MRGRYITKKEIDEMRLLRSKGYSLPEISQVMRRAKSTVFPIIKDVQILPEYEKEWLGKRGGSRKRKLQREAEAFEEGKKLIQELSQKEKMIFLSALYWAEGSKGDFGLSNTDPELVRVFVNGLREVFGVSEDRLRISVRIYEDLDKEKCLEFWSQVVNISKEKFVAVDILKGKKKGKLQYGMCRVRVTKGADLRKKMVAINKVVCSIFVPIVQ